VTRVEQAARHNFTNREIHVGSYSMDNYKMEDAAVANIVAKTEDAVRQMEALKGSVVNPCEMRASADQSAAGRKMYTRLTEWTGDFQTVINSLNQLNYKANEVRKKNVGYADDANIAANG
jgi:hypothetical protein